MKKQGKNKKYKFEEYKPEYKERFKKEKERIKRALTEAKIEHVGSTAVPGLGGKGIIDIAILASKEKLAKYLEKLEDMGYEYKSKPEDDERKFLQRIHEEDGEERRNHIHLTSDDEEWKLMLALRDYLRENEEARDKYGEIKREAIEKNKERQDYRDHKEEFVKKLAKKALDWKKK